MDHNSSGGVYGYGRVLSGAFVSGCREAMNACYDAGIIITASAGNNREKIVNFGKLVFEGNDKVINTKNLSSGIYIINLNSNNNIVTKKVTISK